MYFNISDSFHIKNIKPKSMLTKAKIKHKTQTHKFP